MALPQESPRCCSASFLIDPQNQKLCNHPSVSQLLVLCHPFFHWPCSCSSFNKRKSWEVPSAWVAKSEIRSGYNFQCHCQCHCHCDTSVAHQCDNGCRDLDTSTHCDDTQAMPAKETKQKSRHPHLHIFTNHFYGERVDSRRTMVLGGFCGGFVAVQEKKEYKRRQG